MLDIKYIRENADKIKGAAKNKNIDVDIDKLLNIDEQRRSLITEAEKLRTRRNELGEMGKNGKPSAELITEGKELKNKIFKVEDKLKRVDEEYNYLMAKVPTIPSADTPIGKDDGENVEVFKWGEPRKFDFTPKTHIELGEALDIIDFDRGVKVAGYRGYYLKNEAVSLQMALMLFALEKLISKGFRPMIPPTLIKEFALFGSGYFSGREYNGEVDEIYKIENGEKEADGTVKKDNRFLVGTAEPSLLAYYANETLNEKDLPLKLCGFSQCYRSEIGSYGKDTKGIYRVHEFMKVEQVCLTPADVNLADKLHLEMVEISKELHQDLGLPYHLLQICTGDMSAGKYKMFDIEAWIPSRNTYGETGSASNFLDWQSRRLNVKYKTASGEAKFVYMLNDTALASARTIIAILENFQEADGSIIIPNVLRKWMPGNIAKIEKEK
jgi:seryl-tRNA synthetase